MLFTGGGQDVNIYKIETNKGGASLVKETTPFNSEISRIYYDSKNGLLFTTGNIEFSVKIFKVIGFSTRKLF